MPEEEIASLKAENARLREDMAALRTQIEELAAELQAVQERLAKDSYNSH